VRLPRVRSPGAVAWCDSFVPQLLPEESILSASIPTPRWSSPWWIVLGGVAIASLYCPTLNTRFDFIDDGNLVYPAPAMPWLERLALVGDKIVANYEHLGPFRPVLWVHWELQADLFAGDAFTWRLARLCWCALAACVFLWLLHLLGVHPWAACFTVALAMWNPYRNEIWTSLTLAEGVAMPYALAALGCAVQAGRSARPLPWDIAGVLCVLAALGCKNVFAALVPAQLILRFGQSGLPLLTTCWQQRWRFLALSSTLLLPIVHLIYFKLNWHPGQYLTPGPSWGQLGRILNALKGAMSLEYIGVGLVLAGLALARVYRSPLSALGDVIGQYRLGLLAGLALLLGGVGMYLQMDMMSGRYTMPAVWGLDIALAATLSCLLTAPVAAWRRLALGVLLVGLVGVALANVGRQEKFAARAAMLWQIVEHVQEHAPPNLCLGWVCTSDTSNRLPKLNVEEGIHVAWHLRHRGRPDVRVVLLDADGRPLHRCEIAEKAEVAELAELPTWYVHGPCDQPPSALGVAWQPVRQFAVRYWHGRRTYSASLSAIVRSAICVAPLSD
jgi:hypothetical protein